MTTEEINTLENKVSRLECEQIKDELESIKYY